MIQQKFFGNYGYNENSLAIMNITKILWQLWHYMEKIGIYLIFKITSFFLIILHYNSNVNRKSSTFDIGIRLLSIEAFEYIPSLFDGYSKLCPHDLKLNSTVIVKLCFIISQ